MELFVLQGADKWISGYEDIQVICNYVQFRDVQQRHTSQQ